MKERLLKIKEQALKDLELVKDLAGLEEYRISYLGKKGVLTSELKRLGELTPKDRPEIGKLANQIKSELLDNLERARAELVKKEQKEDLFLDITLPGREPLSGHLHPINQVSKEICDI
jgi:phenylalanyl-tRNA synthetase alpha chain